MTCVHANNDLLNALNKFKQNSKNINRINEDDNKIMPDSSCSITGGINEEGNQIISDLRCNIMDGINEEENIISDTRPEFIRRENKNEYLYYIDKDFTSYPYCSDYKRFKGTVDKNKNVEMFFANGGENKLEPCTSYEDCKYKLGFKDIHGADNNDNIPSIVNPTPSITLPPTKLYRMVYDF